MKKTEPLLLSPADVYAILGRINADNMIKAGWLKPRCYRPTNRGERAIFWHQDVIDCATRIRDGEYPEYPVSKAS